MKFITLDGEIFTGRSYTQIVEKMSQEKLTTPHSLESYRRATARRVKDAYKVDVPSEDDRSFILGLVEVGMLVRE